MGCTKRSPKIQLSSEVVGSEQVYLIGERIIPIFTMERSLAGRRVIARRDQNTKAPKGPHLHKSAEKKSKTTSIFTLGVLLVHLIQCSTDDHWKGCTKRTPRKFGSSWLKLNRYFIYAKLKYYKGLRHPPTTRISFDTSRESVSNGFYS